MESLQYKRFKISSQGISEQLLLSTQIEKMDCTKWALNLIQNEEVKSSLSPEMVKWLESSSRRSLLAFNNLRFQSLSSSVITFTSAVEFYFKDRLLHSLLRNQGLRKKGFTANNNQDSPNANTLFNPIDLENYETIENAILSVVDKLSSIYSKGSKFSDKLKKICKYLELDSSSIGKTLQDSLDSIWLLRNRIAHMNVDKVQEWQILLMDGHIIEYKRNNLDENLKFVLEFIKIAGHTEDALKLFDANVLIKWPTLKPISKSVIKNAPK